LNPGALKELVSKGAKLLPFPAPPVMEAAFKESMALYSELTESTFDNFMQRQKL
jgi:TRAP-type mannitol/chloroaromatic compound transport system substrate-binding protein